MLLRRDGCSVGILRPPTTEMSRLMRDQVDRKRSVGEAEEAAHVDEQIDQMVEMFRMAVEGLGMKFFVTQYQLHGLDALRVVSRRRTRNIAENDILATINPTPSTYAFTTGLHGNPLHRAVLAYTDPQTFEDSAQLLGTGVMDIVGREQSEHQHALRRVFAVYVSPHEATAANRFSGNANIVRQAVLYPDVAPVETTRHTDDLLIPFDRVCDEECRGLFVDAKTAVSPSIRRSS